MHLALAADADAHRATLEETIHQSVWGRMLTPSEVDRVIVESFERQVPAGNLICRMGQPDRKSVV